MSIILELPEELEKELTDEAAGLNLSLPEYALRVLATGRVAGAPPLPRTGAELVAYWQSEGIVGSRSDIEDSQAHARSLRREAETRARS